MPIRIVGVLTRVCIGGIIVGIVFMVQPFVFQLFSWGFMILLFSTLVYIIVSHIPEPERPGEVVGAEGIGELPVSVSGAESSMNRPR
jgi:MFS superfamily sulfate permease-like transporter